MEFSSNDSKHDCAESVPFLQMLENFRTELKHLPDYSPRFKEMLDYIRPTLGIAKRFK